jgi:hypothetical protein
MALYGTATLIPKWSSSPSPNAKAKFLHLPELSAALQASAPKACSHQVAAIDGSHKNWISMEYEWELQYGY